MLLIKYLSQIAKKLVLVLAISISMTNINKKTALPLKRI